MKFAVGIFLLSAIFAMIGMGSFLMHHEMHDDHEECPTAIFGNVRCGNIVNPFEFATSHIGTLAGLMAGIAVSAMLLLIAAFAMLLGRVVSGAAGPPIATAAYFRAQDMCIDSTSKFLRWFSFHEKRDPSLVFAMNA